MDRELLARNEYLAAENRILKSQLNGRLKLSDAERAMLGKIGHLDDVNEKERPPCGGHSLVEKFHIVVKIW